MTHITALETCLRAVSFIVLFAETIFAFTKPLLQAIHSIMALLTASITKLVYVQGSIRETAK
jgi:hypothetical protein